MGRKLILLSLFIVLAEVACFGQFGTPLTSVEAVETHYGEVGDYDLTGFTTYRVYAHLESDDYFLSAIFGSPAGPTQPDSIVLSFNSDCEIFQHPQGGLTAEEINCLLFTDFPALEYDSWLTIGAECVPDDAIQTAFSSPEVETQIELDFNESNGIGMGFLEIFNGAVFTTPSETNPNGIPILDEDGNWKVLVAQFTTCGSFEFEFGASAVLLEEGGDEDVPMSVTNPCTDNPLDIESEFSSLTCFEDSTGMIDIDTLMPGNGNVTFDLYQITDPDDTQLQEDNVTGDFTGLHAGDYFVIASDELGCEIMSDTLNLTQPDSLTLTSTVEQELICAGENIGEISYEAEGGVEPYELYFADGTPISTDSLATGLSCGSNETILEDSNGCTTSVFNQLDCPDPIQIDLQTDSVSCFEACDGSISGTVEGGTGELSYSWTGCEDFTSTDLELTDLCPCDSLVLEVTDDSLCVVTSGMLEINRPDELTITSSVTDVSCFGEESGSINIFAEGGTGVVDIECTDESNDELDDTNALGAGTYYCTATDQNLCSVTDTVVINQPDQPLSINLIDSVRPTCTGFTDGLISVEASGGTPGTSGYSYSITPDPNAPSTGSVFDNLPGNEYAVTVMDSLGCTSILTLNLTEPDPLTFDVETESVTCPGGNDGTLLITESGGDNPYTFTIEDSQDTVLSQVNNGFFQGLQADTFNITVTDNEGCFSTGTTILNEPDSIVAEVQTAVNVTCFGNCNGTILFDITGGTPGYEVVWNGDPTIPNDSLCSGTNLFSVTDSAGCEISGEVEVEFDSGQIDLEFLDENATCTGMSDGSATVLATGGLGELTINAGGINLDSLMSGEYIIQVEDSIGCTVQDTLVIEDDIESDLSLQVFSSQVTCWNESDGTATAAVSGAEGEISYQWNDPEGQTTATAVGLPEEIYTVIVKDSISFDQVCTYTATTVVEPTEGCFFVATALTPNGDGANDEWVVGGLEHFPNSLVQVYNRWGQLMFESRGYPTRWDGRFNGKRLPVADYYYVITFEESGLETLTGTVTIKY